MIQTLQSLTVCGALTTFQTSHVICGWIILMLFQHFPIILDRPSCPLNSTPDLIDVISRYGIFFLKLIMYPLIYSVHIKDPVNAHQRIDKQLAPLCPCIPLPMFIPKLSLHGGQNGSPHNRYGSRHEFICKLTRLPIILTRFLMRQTMNAS